MFLHLVLFRPRADLTPAKRDELFVALEHAMENIPHILRAQVGRRTVLGRRYDEHNAIEFPYVATLEFESEADLRAYLEHPSHATLGTLFYETAEAALAFDFKMVTGTEVSKLREEPSLRNPRP